MTRAEAAEILGLLVAAFPAARPIGRDAEDARATLWEAMLADLDAAATRGAAMRLIATAKFFPTIAEVRESVLAVTVGETRPGGDAWGDVLRSVGRFGAYRSPTFADPIVAEAVAALGWQEICLSENQVADRARFVDLYDRLAATRRKDAAVGALPGARSALPARREQPALAGFAIRDALARIGGAS